MYLTIILAFPILFVLLVVIIYNKGIMLKNYVKEAFSTMDVYMKKRWDLIPKLVEIVKGYSAHEKEVLENVTLLRSKSYSTLSNNEKMGLNNEISQTLGKLIAVTENYPDLKANTNYQDLMTQLVTVENDIALSRKYYNGTVREFNTYIQIFPVVLFAKIFNFTEEKLFEIDYDERQNIKVEL